MPQLINKKKIYFYVFSFLFISTILNNNLIRNLSNIFKVSDIKIENTKQEIDQLILLNTSFLLEKNIFFVNKKKILKNLDKLNFIESISIEKIYPSTIHIKTKVTNFVAITYIDQKKHFVGLNGNFILAKNILNEKKLPIIFGKFNPGDYILLQRELLRQKIDPNEIIKYYFHKNKRWDLHFKNNIIIKLPSKNITKALKLLKEFELNNIIRPGTIIDLRIQNRLILSNE